MPVLLLDGEELAVAKQNRVLNTTVLLKPLSNVSCTERGRWSYATREFRDSDVVMARSIRARKNRSVSAFLNQSRAFRSDQGEIWEEIEALCESAGVCSDTDAMRDVYEGKKHELQTCLGAFPLVEKQRGLVFLVDRAVVGMDLLSRPEAYSGVHTKLLTSYVIDAMPRNIDGQRPPVHEGVRQFIDQVFGCSENSFPSVGLGTDLRLERTEICGSALIHGDTCIHAAFFSNVPFADGPSMRGFRQRRGFRR